MSTENNFLFDICESPVDVNDPQSYVHTETPDGCVYLFTDEGIMINPVSCMFSTQVYSVMPLDRSYDILFVTISDIDLWYGINGDRFAVEPCDWDWDENHVL